MRLEAVVSSVNARLKRGPSNAPAYTTIFGAGFSYPLIPLASVMVRDVPWWLHWSQISAEGAAFVERPVSGAALDDFTTFERSFWSDIHACPERPAALALDPQTGLPDVAKHDAIFAAYQALMDPRLPGVLSDPAQRRGYMRAAIERIDKRVNRAHVLLASILSAQQSPEWSTRFRRPFCRTVFTTNFDPLMQRTLQLVQTLYFMTDRPELLEPPSDDEHPAIHLLYTHGSVHRHLLLNTAEEIARAQTRNAPALSDYLKHKGVFVIGYSGWMDTVMSALRACESFDGNLYWFNVHTPQQAAQSLSREVVEFLASRRGNAFYVQATADEAMAALHSALGLGDAPRFVLDPLGPMRAALDDVVLPESVAASASASGGEPQKGQLILANMQAQLARTRERLKLAHEVFQDPSIAEAGKSSHAVRRAVAASEMQKADAAYAAGQLEDALALWRGVAAEPAGLEPEVLAQAWQNAGVTLYNLERYAEAAQAYTSGLAVAAPQSAARFQLLSARGYLAERDRNWPAAEADYRAALTLAHAEHNVEWESGALNDLAGVLMEVERFDEAIALFQRALELPNAPIFQRMRGTNNLGVIAYRRGDVVGFKQRIAQAHELDPESAYPPMNLALIQLLEGEAEGAQEAYRKALPQMTDADFLRRATLDLQEAQSRFHLNPADVAATAALITARAQELGH